MMMKKKEAAMAVFLVFLVFTSQYAWLVKAATTTTLTVSVTDAASKPLQNAQVSIEKWSPWLGLIPRWELKYKGTTDSSGKYIASVNDTGSFRATADYSGSSKTSEPFEIPGATSVTIKIDNYVTSTITITVLDSQRAPRGGGQVKLEHITKFVGLVPYVDFSLEGVTGPDGVVQWKEWIPAGHYRITIMWPGTSEGDLYDTKEVDIVGDLTLVYLSRYAWFYAPIGVETVGINSNYGFGDWSMGNNWAGVRIERASSKLTVTTVDGVTLEYLPTWQPYEDTFYGRGKGFIPIKMAGSFDSPWIEEKFDWEKLGYVNATCFPVFISFEGHEQLVWYNQISWKSIWSKWENKLFVTAAIVGFLALCIATGGTAGFAASIATGIIPLVLSSDLLRNVTPDMTFGQMLSVIEESGGPRAKESVLYFVENFRSNGALARQDDDKFASNRLYQDAPLTPIGGYDWTGWAGRKVTEWLDNIASLGQTVVEATQHGLPIMKKASITTVEGNTFSLVPNDVIVFSDGESVLAGNLAPVDSGRAMDAIEWFGVENPYQQFSLDNAPTLKVSTEPTADAMKATRESGLLDKALDEAGATPAEKSAVFEQSKTTEEACRASGTSVGSLTEKIKDYIRYYPKFTEMSKVGKIFTVLGLAWTAFSVWQYLTDLGRKERTCYAGLVIDVTAYSLTVGGLALVTKSYGGGGIFGNVVVVDGIPCEVRLEPQNQLAKDFNAYGIRGGAGTYEQVSGGFILSENGLLYCINSARSSGNAGALEGLVILKVTPRIPSDSTEWKLNYGMSVRTALLGWQFTGGGQESQLESVPLITSPCRVREVMRSRGGIWQADVAGDEFVVTWASNGKFYAPVAISGRTTLQEKIWVKPQGIKVYFAMIQFHNKAPLAAVYLPEPQPFYDGQIQISAKEIITSGDYINKLLPSIPIIGPLLGGGGNPDWWKDEYGNLIYTGWWNPFLQDATWTDYLKALWDENLGKVGQWIADAFKGLGNWFMDLIGIPGGWMRDNFGWIVLLILILLLAALFILAFPLFVWLLKALWFLIKFALFVIFGIMLIVPYLIIRLIDLIFDKDYHETIEGAVGSAWGWVTGKEGGGEE